MKNEMPLVSIIMNCYNGEKYLKEAINSVCEQTFTNWELVFWDNASTDSSAKIFKSFEDDRLKYYRSKHNVTLGQARAWAVDKCNGEYIGFLDVDDKWLPKKLEVQVNQMILENAHLSYSAVQFMQNEKIISVSTPKYSSGYIFDKQLKRFEINMPSSMFKKEAIEVLNINFDPKIIGSEEYDLFIQIAAKYNVSVIKEPLCVYRILSGSLTNKSIQNRAQDKRFTFEKLERDFQDEISRYKRSYKKAKSKIYYYEFQYQYSISNFKEAKKSLHRIVFVDYRYTLLYVSLLVFPALYGKIVRLLYHKGL